MVRKRSNPLWLSAVCCQGSDRIIRLSAISSQVSDINGLFPVDKVAVAGLVDAVGRHRKGCIVIFAQSFDDPEQVAGVDGLHLSVRLAVPVVKQIRVGIFIEWDMVKIGHFQEDLPVAFFRGAEYADLHGILIAPHGVMNGLIGIAAHVHAGAVMPDNYIAFEYCVAKPEWWYDIIDGLPDPIVKNGFIEVWDKPGLGVLFNKKAAKRYLTEEDTGFFD